MILATLEARGLELEPAADRRLRASRSLTELQRWALRASEVLEIDELFAPE